MIRYIALFAVALILLTGCGKESQTTMISQQGTSQFQSPVPEINRIAWQMKLDPDSSFNYGEQNIYYWSGKDFHAVDYETGQKLWSVQLDRNVVVAVDSQGTTIANGDDYFLHAYQSKDGQLLWKKDMGHNFDLVSIAGDVVVIADINSRLIGVDLKTGEVKWSLDKIGQASDSFTPVYKDTIYVQADQESIAAVDVKTGKLKSKINLKKRGELKQYMVAADTLYTINKDLHIDAYDSESGNIKWTYSDSDSSFMAFHNGFVYSLTSSVIDVIDAKTGKKAREVNMASHGFISASFSIAGGDIYLGTRDGDKGKIISIDAGSGLGLWAHKLEYYILTQPVIHKQKLYAVNKQASLVAFDAQ